MPDPAWTKAGACAKNNGTESAPTLTVPEPKPTATWSRSLPDNITPPWAVEQGHVQNATCPKGESTFKAIGELAAALVRKAGAQ